MRAMFSWRMAWQHIAAFAFAVAVSGLGISSRIIPIEIVGGSITPQVKSGDFIVITRQISWARSDCTSLTIASELVDSIGYSRSQAQRVPAIPTLATRTSREWQVPFTMPLGKSVYRARVAFACFPFHELWPLVVQLPDLEFEVVR